LLARKLSEALDYLIEQWPKLIRSVGAIVADRQKLKYDLLK